MKKFLILLLAFILPATAMASTTFDGTVIAGSTIPVTAPFGGTISGLSIRSGSRISLGDAIAEIQTTKVYAPADGTVVGVFAQEGDSVESVTSCYGAVMSIMPENRYTISATIEKAYNSSETKYITIGEKVYMTCTGDGDHTAQGIVTTANGNSYTVESTSGELMISETVYIYRDASCSASSRIGRGTVGRTAEIPVTANGSILKLHVQNGDTVQRGDLLFETVTGDLDGLYAVSNQLLSQYSGIVSEVNTAVGSKVSKGDTLLTLCPMDSLLVEISVSEYDLSLLQEGSEVSITFQYDENTSSQVTGIVTMISHLSSGSDAEASYQATVAFTPPNDIRLGMTAVVETLADE